MGAREQLAAVAGLTRRAAAAPLRLPGAAARETVAVLRGTADRATRALVQHVDLTPLVAEVVDLDALVAGVDIDAIAQRLDIDAVIDRVDLVRIVESVLAEIDLPEIIRESTGSMASDTLMGARLQGISADEAVTRVMDRLRPPSRRVAVSDGPSSTAP